MILYQAKYENEILIKFNIFECNYTITPADTNLNFGESDAGEEDKVDATMFKQLVGSLRYLCQSRPHISFSVGLVIKFMSNPLDNITLL